MAMPGDNVTIDVDLIHPIAIEKERPSPFVKVAGPWALGLLPKSNPKRKPSIVTDERNFSDCAFVFLYNEVKK